jgi:hypothetical protein
MLPWPSPESPLCAYRLDRAKAHAALQELTKSGEIAG